MFVTFIKLCTGTQYLLGATHSLMSLEDLEKYINDILPKNDKILLSYYAKKQINKDPLKVIPEKLITASNLVIWMDLYSTEWKIIKDPENIAAQFQGRWKMNMEKMGGGKGV
jgi:hypothetical protein